MNSASNSAPANSPAWSGFRPETKKRPGKSSRPIPTSRSVLRIARALRSAGGLSCRCAWPSTRIFAPSACIAFHSPPRRLIHCVFAKAGHSARKRASDASAAPSAQSACPARFPCTGPVYDAPRAQGAHGARCRPPVNRQFRTSQLPRTRSCPRGIGGTGPARCPSKPLAAHDPTSSHRP